MSILQDVRNLCSEFEIMFKLNSVINRFNLNEDMTQQVEEINPVRSVLGMGRISMTMSRAKKSFKYCKFLTVKLHFCDITIKIIYGEKVNRLSKRFDWQKLPD